MATTDGNIDALLEMDRFVRLMGAASGPGGIVPVVRVYLASWPKDRVARLNAVDAGWSPFDDCLRPFSIASVEDVRQIRNSVRIRCRELEASGTALGPELLELDLFFFFANESLEVHESRPAEFDPADAADDAWPVTGSQHRRPDGVRWALSTA